jgi:hypothetical protein
MNGATIYESLPVVAELNRVEGFDPRSFMREIETDTQEKQLYLDVKYRKLWFRLKHPNGKIKKSIIKLTEQLAIVEAKVYLDKNDPEENYVASALAQRFLQQDDRFGNRYVELAETASVGRALADAGFGIQFCDIGEESDPGIVDSGIPVGSSSGKGAGPVTGTQPSSNGQSTAGAAPAKTPAPAQPPQQPKTQPPKASYTSATPVDEIYNLMTLDEAKKVVVDCGYNKGKTMSQVALEKPGSLDWYVDSYKGPNNILRAAAKLLINSAVNTQAS